jgi:hypothetical protein
MSACLLIPRRIFWRSYGMLRKILIFNFSFRK